MQIPLESIPLTYARARRGPRDHFSDWWTGLPRWVVGLILLTPFWVADYFGLLHNFLPLRTKHLLGITSLVYFVLFFVTGAIQRINWRHLLVMLGVALLMYAIEAAPQRFHFLRPPFPYWTTTFATLAIGLMFFAEWLLAPSRSPATLLWLILVGVLVACLIALVLTPMLHAGVPIKFPQPFGYRRTELLSTVLYWPLMTILGWLAVPTASRLARSYQHRQAVAWMGLATAIAVFILSFHFGMYAIARRSIINDGPFDRDLSLHLLHLRGNSGDVEAMWVSLENLDEENAGSTRYQELRYRELCVELLMDQDRAEAGRRFLELLLRRPSKQLAGLCAHLIAQEQRHEAVPVLMRYAMLGDWRCRSALERMGVPQAAGMILRDLSFHELSGEEIEPVDQRCLTALLGKDMGPKLAPWETYYKTSLNEVPTPLTDEQTRETERVIRALLSYINATKRLEDARFYPTAVALPDWNVPDTESLEKEVVSYSERADERIAKKRGTGR